MTRNDLRATIALWLVTFVVPCMTQAAPADRTTGIDVRVDPRVELFSVIFRLAGNREYNQARVPAYAEAADAWFEPHREHEAVRLAADLRRRRGVSYDAVMSMAIHVRDVETLREIVPFDDPHCSLEARWQCDEARAFLDAARSFVTETAFVEFLGRHADLYEITESRMHALLEAHADIDWFDTYFGATADADFTVVLGLLNGGANYGPKIVLPDGRESLYAIMGVWMLDAEGRPRFDRSILPTFVHEFSHSYVNHLVLARADELRASGETIYPVVEAAMRRQAYGNWTTMFCESLVRAAVVRYVALHDGPGEAARQTVYEEERCSFLWTGALSRRLEAYESDRQRFPSLEAFMPEVIGFFDETAETVRADAAEAAEKDRRAKAARPHLVTMTPANGRQDVAPDTDQLIFRFDRPMGPGYSLMLAPGGRATFPPVHGVEFDDDGRVFIARVTLRPGTEYAFSLNGPDGGNFKSVDGTALEMIEVRFRTAGDAPGSS